MADEPKRWGDHVPGLRQIQTIVSFIARLIGDVAGPLADHLEDTNNPHDVTAGQVKFRDGDTIQDKYDNNELGGGGGDVGVFQFSVPEDGDNAGHLMLTYTGAVPDAHIVTEEGPLKGHLIVNL